MPTERIAECAGCSGRKYLRQGEGMVLRPGWSIHTAFMRFPIDAVFLDADQVVIKIEHEVGPWRTVSCRGAREVVELSAGECRRRGLEVGDRVAWASRSAADARADRAAGVFDDEVDEPRARVLVASRDPRFLRLARFLLGGRDFEVEELTSPERLPEAILQPTIDIAVLDGADTVAEAFRTANAARARTTRDPRRHRCGHRREEPLRDARLRPLERDRGAACRTSNVCSPNGSRERHHSGEVESRGQGESVIAQESCIRAGTHEDEAVARA